MNNVNLSYTLCGGLAAVSLFLGSCQEKRDGIVANKASIVLEEVKLGDNIFDAREKLQNRGMKCSEPYFPTASKSEYWMNVDYGVTTTASEKMLESLDATPDKKKMISALIRAKPNGVIFKIDAQ
jgi:hypothetical protein